MSALRRAAMCLELAEESLKQSYEEDKLDQKEADAVEARVVEIVEMRQAIKGTLREHAREKGAPRESVSLRRKKR
jgi:hypothetical protein